MHRLGRTLERVFERVDSDRNGGVTKGELMAALTGGGSQPEVPPQPSASPAGGDAGHAATAAVAISFVSVTFTAMAVRSYSAVEQLALPPPETTPQLPQQPQA